MRINLDKYQRASFRYGGRGPDCFDCWGLVLDIMITNGVDLPDQETPGLHRERYQLLTDGAGHYHKVSDPQGGEIVAISEIPGIITHVGVMLDRVRFIHASETAGVAVERIDSLIWRHQVAGFYQC